MQILQAADEVLSLEEVAAEVAAALALYVELKVWRTLGEVLEAQHLKAFWMRQEEAVVVHPVVEVALSEEGHQWMTELFLTESQRMVVV